MATGPRYAHDPAGTRYSPLTQINPANVANLKLAWKYRFRSEKELTEPLVGFAFSQVTPIVVNGVMYLPSGKRVVALEPETGKEIWSYEMTDGQPVGSWRIVLAGRSHQSAAHHLYRRQKNARAERQDRQG